MELYQKKSKLTYYFRLASSIILNLKQLVVLKDNARTTIQSINKLTFEGVKSNNPRLDRIIIAIAGLTGSGKSYIAQIVKDLMNEISMKTSLVPTDGFHLNNETLKRVDLLDRKSGPETL